MYNEGTTLYFHLMKMKIQHISIQSILYIQQSKKEKQGISFHPPIFHSITIHPYTTTTLTIFIFNFSHSEVFSSLLFALYILLLILLLVLVQLSAEMPALILKFSFLEQNRFFLFCVLSLI